MNKRFLLSIAGMAALTLNAATLAITGSHVVVQEGAYHPVISADGNKVLYTADDYMGLKKIDLSRGEIVKLSDAPRAGFAPRFETDDDNIAMAPAMGHVQARTNHRNIEVTIDGKVSHINPVEDAYSYIWVKLSPDAKRIVFVEPYKGVFVCNLDGSALVSLGRGNFPSWLGNDFVLVNRSIDDGYHVTASHIEAVEVATGRVTAITAADSMTEEASGSVEAGKIVCSDVNGRLSVIDFSINE